jgi:hypothetical protein
MKKRNSLPTIASENEIENQRITTLSTMGINALAVVREEMTSAAPVSDSDTTDTVDERDELPPGVPKSGARPTGCPLGRGRNCRLPARARCPRRRDSSAYCAFEQ